MNDDCSALDAGAPIRKTKPAEFREAPLSNNNPPSPPVAVIGMACRFPGARDCDEFWDNLEQGASQIKRMPEDRWRDIERFLDEPRRASCRRGGFVDDADKFDADFFGIAPREAQLMDPQQRWMLELTWSCLEDAGYDPASLEGSKTGVFIGTASFDYRDLQEKTGAPVEGHTSLGSYVGSVTPNRISYHFGLRGPSVPVEAACASSLYSIHTAMRSLHAGDCDLALAGGVNLLCGPDVLYFVQQTGHALAGRPLQDV